MAIIDVFMRCTRFLLGYSRFRPNRPASTVFIYILSWKTGVFESGFLSHIASMFTTDYKRIICNNAFDELYHCNQRLSSFATNQTVSLLPPMEREA